MRTIKSLLKKVYYFFNECLFLIFSKRSIVPVRFYSARPNVGDALNSYLLSRVSGRQVFEVKSGWLPHVLGVGSIMHFGTKKSVAWGTGIIGDKQYPEASILKKMKFSAVRGKKTRDLLEMKLGKDLKCPLGDPAVLMSMFYTPKIQGKYPLGIVPHYVDKETTGFRKLLSVLDARIIDVELPVEEFLNQLAECEVIVSSSLHGLILSDTYNIPNVWVKFSSKIIGGDFKFLDYYSTTDSKNPLPVDLSKPDCNVCGSETIISMAKIAKFTEDKKLLLDAFPVRL